MNSYVPWILIGVSLALLGLGLYGWRLTSSRGLLMNGVFGSLSLLYAAYEALARHKPEWTFVLPFFATMLFGGRAAGLWWRGRKEAELQLPARVVGTGAALALLATVMAYLSL